MTAPGFCQCGCGQRTSIVRKNIARLQLRKGEFHRYVPGHSARTGTGLSYKSVGVAGRTIKTHIVIAEAALGHPLPPGAVIHHVDDNKRNNANTNLVICQDHGYHLHLHVRTRVVRAGGNPNTQRICAACRKLVFFDQLVGGARIVSLQHQGWLCKPCHAIRAWRSRRRKDPTIDERRASAVH